MVPPDSNLADLHAGGIGFSEAFLDSGSWAFDQWRKAVAYHPLGAAKAAAKPLGGDGYREVRTLLLTHGGSNEVG